MTIQAILIAVGLVLILALLVLVWAEVDAGKK